jgi:hypothetical protein
VLLLGLVAEAPLDDVPVDEAPLGVVPLLPLPYLPVEDLPLIEPHGASVRAHAITAIHLDIKFSLVKKLKREKLRARRGHVLPACRRMPLPKVPHCPAARM